MNMNANRVLPLSIALALALAACGSPSPSEPPREVPPPAGTASTEDRPAAGSASVELALEVFYLERIVLPADARLELSVRASPDPDGALLAQTTVEDPGQPPYRLALKWDGAADEVWVDATLRLPDGSPRFGTPGPQRFVPGGAEVLPLRLVAVERESGEEALATGPRWVYYQCGDMPVEARFEADGSLWLTLPDRDLRLARAESAPGTLYEAGQDRFEAEGLGSARLVVAGAEAIGCELAEGRSPWAAARDRGVAFRAIGVEPFWHVEIEVGDAPTIRLGRLGEADIERVGAALPDQAGFVAEDLRVELFREPCVEAMSGQAYPMRAEVALAGSGERLSGCGRFLF